MRYANVLPVIAPDPLRDRIAVEDQWERVMAAHSYTEHTALRAFGPSGRLAPIPDEHLVDCLTSSFNPSADAPTRSLEVLDRLPECDHCGPGVLARSADVLRHHDGRLLSATLCRSCHSMRRASRISIVMSVDLVLLAEARDTVRDQVNARALREGRPSPWANDDFEPDWTKHYRACGFGEPDAHGEMSREILGESVWVRAGANETVRVTATHRDGTHTYTSVDNYTAPATWTEEQVRHLFRQIFPLSQRTDSCSRLEDPLAAAEARLRRALDRNHFPETLLEDVPHALRSSARLPHGPSLAMNDAQRCAQMSRDTSLLRRLTTEHPALAVRRTSRRRIEQLEARTGTHTFRASRPPSDFDDESWITWRHQAPSWSISRFATRRWATEAGIHDALFNLDGSLEKRWIQGLRSRPASIL